MKVVETTVESYVDDLTNLIEEIGPTHLIGGERLLFTLAKIDEFYINNASHAPIYDDALHNCIMHPDVCAPVSSYSGLLFNGRIVVAQIYINPHTVMSNAQ